MDKLEAREKQEQSWVELSFCACNDMTGEPTENFLEERLFDSIDDE